MGGIWLGRSRALQQGVKHQPPPLTLRGTFRFCKMLLFAVITTFPWSKQSIHNVAFSHYAAKVSLRQVTEFSRTHSCQVVQKRPPTSGRGTWRLCPSRGVTDASLSHAHSPAPGTLLHPVEGPTPSSRDHAWLPVRNLCAKPFAAKLSVSTCIQSHSFVF